MVIYKLKKNITENTTALQILINVHQNIIHNRRSNINKSTFKIGFGGRRFIFYIYTYIHTESRLQTNFMDYDSCTCISYKVLLINKVGRNFCNEIEQKEEKMESSQLLLIVEGTSKTQNLTRLGLTYY